MDQDEEGNFYVEGIKVILKDVMGTNGVIHIIDDVIIPETAKSVSEALQQKGRHTLKELFDLAGINEDSGLSNVTIFGPSEEVIRKMEFFDRHCLNYYMSKQTVQYKVIICFPFPIVGIRGIR